MTLRTAGESMQEQQRQRHHSKRVQRQQRQQRQHRLPLLFLSRQLFRPRHLNSSCRPQSFAHSKAKQRDNRYTIKDVRSKSTQRGIEQESNIDSDIKQYLQHVDSMTADNSNFEKGSTRVIDHITAIDNPCLNTLLSTFQSSTSVCTIQPYTNDEPAARFELLERLGYGSSGSSVFKARDRWNDLNTVAIKKIPLATLTDSFSLTKDYEVLQEEIDFFVSSIVDHYGNQKEMLVSSNREDPCFALENSDNMAFNDDQIEYPNIQRRRSSTSSELTSGLDQVVKSLGCLRNNTELWIVLELCAGGSVADLIRLSDGSMTESEIGWIMSQVLLGLAYLHSIDHVHGDIKASNIMLTLDGHVKLGGSGSIMSHKEGAGERKRRRRSLTMSEFPTSWLAPESSLSPPLSPNFLTDSFSESTPLQGRDRASVLHQYRLLSMPGASTETDVWALGVACIELSQGRPPRPETPILASYGDWRHITTLGNIASATGDVSAPTSQQNGWHLPNDVLETVGMGMSEEMWVFIRKCLAPDPEARPTVQELLQDPFIVRHGKLSQELLLRIRSMVDFVGQCASISEGLIMDRSGSDSSLVSTVNSLGSNPPSITLSPSKATHMIDFKMDEPDWMIPRIRPRVDSVYDESSFFDEAGVPRSIGPLEQGPSQALVMADWKHQRVSHPKVMQALLCDQPRYLTFRHSRSPSLATIVEHHMEEDALFWSDDEVSSGNDGDHSSSDQGDDDNSKHDNCNGAYEKHNLLYSRNTSNVFHLSMIQENQDQRQQVRTKVHDKSNRQTAQVASQAAHDAYLDNLAYEKEYELRSIIEYDLHGASSRLVVLYEIRESWVQ